LLGPGSVRMAREELQTITPQGRQYVDQGTR
jgi:hypothetical protein